MPSSDNVATFAEAVDHQKEHGGSPSLLIGNGFSIDWRPDVFAYTSLYEEADLADLSTSKEDLFNRLDTHDFEIVIDYLRQAAGLAELYRPKDQALAKTLRADAQVVKNGLADVLARRHPKRPAEITVDEARHARLFLSNFRRIFSVNYDLLLYWVVNRTEVGQHVPQQDGFEWPSLEDRSKLIWKSARAIQNQRISYLHGGFHLFVEDKRLRKLDYDGQPLIKQVMDRIDAGQYPLVVTEGRTNEKLSRISKSSYLRFCLQQFRELDTDLFIHGLSLASNDDHIFGALADAESHVRTLYVGLHEPDSDNAQDTMQRARRIARKRKVNKGAKLNVRFYDMESAHVWRSGVP